MNPDLLILTETINRICGTKLNYINENTILVNNNLLTFNNGLVSCESKRLKFRFWTLKTLLKLCREEHLIELSEIENMKILKQYSRSINLKN